MNPMPVSVLKRMGADFTIAVNVLPDISDRDKTRWVDRGKACSDKEPNIFSILMQSVYMGSHILAKAYLKDADIVIQAKVAHIGPTDFGRARDCIEQGTIAAQGSITEIRRKLEA